MKCTNCGNDFEGKFCPECGTPTPRSATCPNCGAEVAGKFCAECGTPITPDPVASSAAAEEPSVVFHATQQCGQLLIDAQNKLWRIAGEKGVLKHQPQSTGGNKFAKGALAVLTGGASLVVEAAAKGVAGMVGPKDIPTYSFDQLLNYDLLEDDETITTGGVGQALVGGALFAGVGAVVGGLTAKRKTKRIVNSITIKLTLNDFSRPCIMLPLLEKPVKVKSKEYEMAYNTAQKMLSMLDVITHNS